MKNKNIKFNTQQFTGFTLIELLIVIAIIGLLAGIISLGISSAKVKARDAKRAGDIRQFITALEQYYIHNGTYPTGTGSTPAGPGGTGINLDDPTAMDAAYEALIPNYVPYIPKAPTPADGDCLDTLARGSNNYWYESMEDGSNYTITFCLGKDTESWAKGIRSASSNGVQ